MMSDAIKNFAKQFKYRPKVEGGKVKKYKKFVVAGMGGSHLAGGIVKTLKPELDLVIWHNYGLPELSEKDWKRTLVIASSYSGNTEEPIDAFQMAIEKKLPLAVIAVGGKLLDLAKQSDVPYIQLPDTGIQPRSALGFSLMAFLKAMKESELLKQAKELAKNLDPKGLENEGKALAEKARGKVPVIYASQRNESLAYNWKIKFNETGKVPAFYNTFPELNHNEMTGFDPVKSSASGGGPPEAAFNRASLQEKFYMIMIKDQSDHPQIQKRLDVTAKLYRDRGLSVETIDLKGQSKLEQIFSSLILADWAAFYTAQGYRLESEQVPMVEEFKKLIV